jgi:hypothetical protein
MVQKKSLKWNSEVIEIERIIIIIIMKIKMGDQFLIILFSILLF